MAITLLLVVPHGSQVIQWSIRVTLGILMYGVIWREPVRTTVNGVVYCQYAWHQNLVRCYAPMRLLLIGELVNWRISTVNCSAWKSASSPLFVNE